MSFGETKHVHFIPLIRFLRAERPAGDKSLPVGSGEIAPWIRSRSLFAEQADCAARTVPKSCALNSSPTVKRVLIHFHPRGPSARRVHRRSRLLSHDFAHKSYVSHAPRARTCVQRASSKRIPACDPRSEFSWNCLCERDGSRFSIEIGSSVTLAGHHSSDNSHFLFSVDFLSFSSLPRKPKAALTRARALGARTKRHALFPSFLSFLFHSRGGESSVPFEDISLLLN